MGRKLHRASSSFQLSSKYPITQPAPLLTTLPAKLSHSLPLPLHLVVAFVSTVMNVLAAAVVHLVDGPVRPSWNFLTTLTHAVMKSVIVTHPPQGRHSLDILAVSRMPTLPLPAAGGSIRDDEVLVTQPGALSAIVKSALTIDARQLSAKVDYSGMSLRSFAGEWVRHKSLGAATDSEPVTLFLHGGGHMLMSPKTHRILTANVSRATGGSVFVPDYRMALDGPFPSAIEDALACYLALTGLSLPTDDGTSECRASFSKTSESPENTRVSPSRIFVMGDSSGGCLTAQFAIMLRSLDLPKPAGIVLISPLLDNEFKASSHHTNWDSDFMTFDLDGLKWGLDFYASGLPTSHPAITPMNADLAGLPPMLIQAGDSETLADDSINFHRRSAAAGNRVELQLYTDMFHVFQMIPFIPQTADALGRIGHFVRHAMAVRKSPRNSRVRRLSRRASRITLVNGKCIKE
ncbi:alpha/beta hydrolase fold-domain-containing protein [Entophlyctis helioformis]|nr:alpha/beta hydrolase fold-domain-containing protein [Entophlyctis helioformis]